MRDIVCLVLSTGEEVSVQMPVDMDLHDTELIASAVLTYAKNRGCDIGRIVELVDVTIKTGTSIIPEPMVIQ